MSKDVDLQAEIVAAEIENERKAQINIAAKKYPDYVQYSKNLEAEYLNLLTESSQKSPNSHVKYLMLVGDTKDLQEMIIEDFIGVHIFSEIVRIQCNGLTAEKVENKIAEFLKDVKYQKIISAVKRKHCLKLQSVSLDSFKLLILEDIPSAYSDYWLRLIDSFEQTNSPDFLIATVHSMKEYKKLPTLWKELFVLVDLASQALNRVIKKGRNKPDIIFFDKKQTININKSEHKFGDYKMQYTMLESLYDKFDTYVIDDHIIDKIGLNREEGDDYDKCIQSTKRSLINILKDHNLTIKRRRRKIGVSDGAYKLTLSK